MAYRRTTLQTLTDEQLLAALRGALEQVDGNVARAAHLLGVKRRQVYHYLHQIPGAWGVVDEVRARATRELLDRKARLLGRHPVGSPPWTTKSAPSARPSSTPPRA